MLSDSDLEFLRYIPIFKEAAKDALSLDEKGWNETAIP